MLTDSQITQFNLLASNVRKNIILAIHNAQTGHPGPSLSMVEILILLYFKYLNYTVENPQSINRDYFILSKGHGSPALYAVLSEAGFISQTELITTLRKFGGRLQGHPNANCLPGIDVSTGSLGQGISIATGLALGLKLNKQSNKVYCILGDGELQEGQNWEAAMYAAFKNLNNLIVFVDYNCFQSDGPTEKIMDLGDLAAKWKAFDWNVYSNIDGHDWHSLDTALQDAISTTSKPSVIIAHTIKGKGVSYMEGVSHWHHHPINSEDYKLAMEGFNK